MWCLVTLSIVGLPFVPSRNELDIVPTRTTQLTWSAVVDVTGLICSTVILQLGVELFSQNDTKLSRG